jgi:hypothetical protein
MYSNSLKHHLRSGRKRRAWIAMVWLTAFAALSGASYGQSGTPAQEGATPPGTTPAQPSAPPPEAALAPPTAPALQVQPAPQGGPSPALSATPAQPPAQVRSESRNRAAGFVQLPTNARVLLMPSDIELYVISAGGVVEPRADWTQEANRHFRAALLIRKQALGSRVIEADEKQVDEIAEINSLHAAVANAIALHHFGPDMMRLPTKEGQLDWSLGDGVRAIRDKTGADYALFTWMRDSYASSERIAATVLLALVGIGMAPGGLQQGYASLVDLNTGRIVWFNRLFRTHGDLREAEKAAQTLDALLTDFPSGK